MDMEKLTIHRSHKVRPSRQQPTAKQERKRNEENKYLRFLRGALTGRLPSVLRSGQSLNLFLLRSIRSLSHSENTKLQRRGRWVESKPIRVTLRARMEMRGRVWNERTLKWQKANPKGVAWEGVECAQGIRLDKQECLKRFLALWMNENSFSISELAVNFRSR